MDGVNCYECPIGADCTQEIVPVDGTNTPVQYGVSNPKTLQGYFLDYAPESQKEKLCDVSQWGDGDPCKDIEGETLQDKIHKCAQRIDSTQFGNSWDSDRVYMCLAEHYFYKCDVRIFVFNRSNATN